MFKKNAFPEPTLSPGSLRWCTAHQVPRYVGYSITRSECGGTTTSLIVETGKAMIYMYIVGSSGKKQIANKMHVKSENVENRTCVMLLQKRYSRRCEGVDIEV